MRIYKVTNEQAESERLIKAHTRAGAVAIAAKKDYKAEVASQEDVHRLAKAGVEVEQ